MKPDRVNIDWEYTTCEDLIKKDSNIMFNWEG